MNVGIITPRYPPNTIGGGEISVQLLAGQLSQQSQVESVTVFSFDGRTDGTDKNGTLVKRLGKLPKTVELSNIYAVRKLRERVSSLDLLHGYNMALHPTVGYLSETADIPSVATLNSYAYLPKPVDGLDFTLVDRIRSRTTDRIARQCINGIDTLIGLSQAIIDIYRSSGVIHTEFAHVPNMVDPTFVSPAAGPNDGSTELLFVGNLEPWKGVRYLITALADLPPDYTLRIVGTGSSEQSLRELRSELGLGDRVVFRGQVPYGEIPSVYATADVFVHPGIWPEPFPRTMLEAMQSGLSVVCTDIGAPPEILPDSDLVAPPRDPAALAECIMNVAGRSEAIGTRNQRLVETNYRASAVVPQILEVYTLLTQRST